MSVKNMNINETTEFDKPNNKNNKDKYPKKKK